MTGGSDGILAGVLVFVLGGLLVLQLWAVVDAKQAADAAARAGARAYAEASTEGGAQAAAAAATAATLAGRHKPPASAVFLPPAGSFARCQRVMVLVQVRLQAVHLPGIALGPTFTVTGRHSTVIDPYRDGDQLGDGLGC